MCCCCFFLFLSCLLFLLLMSVFYFDWWRFMRFSFFLSISLSLGLYLEFIYRSHFMSHSMALYIYTSKHCASCYRFVYIISTNITEKTTTTRTSSEIKYEPNVRKRYVYDINERRERVDSLLSVEKKQQRQKIASKHGNKLENTLKFKRYKIEALTLAFVGLVSKGSFSTCTCYCLRVTVQEYSYQFLYR